MSITFRFREAELAHIASGGNPRTTYRAHLRTRYGSSAHGTVTGRLYFRLFAGPGTPFDFIKVA